MIKHGVVTSNTPSVVSGRRKTVIRDGESVREDETLPDVLAEPLEKSAMIRGTLPKPKENDVR